MNDKEWEQLVDRALRQLPLRTAPPTLESRVHRALQRRAALPWWRQSFVHWPTVARAAFVLVCIALASAMLLEGTRVAAIFPALPQWLYVGLAFGGFLYALLFGLGAAVYRALYLNLPFKVTT